MTYSVLLLGATGLIGKQIAAKLAKYQGQLGRVAFLTSSAQATPDKEAKYAAVPIQRVIGDYQDPDTYRGFDIVVCALATSLALEQIKYADAAFKGGVKHFYPTEFGFDLKHELVLKEPATFSEKIEVRKHLQEKADQDASIGYTFLMTGIFGEWLTTFNALGLSEDKSTAQFYGEPNALVTMTDDDDIAEFTVLSLLPSHLKSLSDRRELRVSGSTLPVSEYFDTVSRILGRDIAVTYLSRESSYEYEKKQKELGNEYKALFTVVGRVLGFGGSVMRNPDSAKYPEFKATSWEDVVTRTLA
ncbi:hypothetical protein D9613_007432 [Agrocybe pediades]|uniref:NmrA-like domain-containing protein n=1 Tax=Agrocybe pediades TaxID=84607 RepID=A0A8H4QNH2_9AGAR|nr:hypothetical protein D9613_007432 [Agrocybe pediades]